MRRQSEREAPTLLVPLDGSRLAEAVLPAVEALATHGCGRVILLHILERNPPATVHGERHLHSLGEAMAYVDEVARRLRAAGVDAATHVHDAPVDDVARSIANHAEELGTDLVVLCTHGGGGLRGFLFGSIAQQALQHGTLSILLVRPPSSGGSAPDFEVRSLLVPLDGTPAHEPALDAAIAVAHMFAASIHLAMVIPTLSTLSGGQAVSGMMLPTTTKAVLDLAEQNALDYLEQMRARCAREQVEATSEVLRGDPVLAVLDLARRMHASLIVMGSHGRAGLDAQMAGSVAKGITDKGTTPILLVRARDADSGDER